MLKDLGKIALGVVAAVAGIGAAIGKTVLDTAAASDALVEMSDKTGLSVEKLQELSYVGKQVGVDTETVTGSLARMIRNMSSAREGTGAAAEAFKQLGVSVTDSTGQLRPSQEVFAELIDKLGTMPNETERDAAAMAILGKSAQELNPLIKAGSEQLAKLTEEAHTSGAVMKTETVQGMADLNDTIDSLKDGLTGTIGTLASSFLPAFQGLAGKAQGYLGQLVGIVQRIEWRYWSCSRWNCWADHFHPHRCFIQCSGYAAGRVGNHPGIDQWDHEQHSSAYSRGDQDADDAGEIYIDQYSSFIKCSDPNCDRSGQWNCHGITRADTGDRSGGDHHRYDITAEFTHADRGSSQTDHCPGSGIGGRLCRY